MLNTIIKKVKNNKIKLQINFLQIHTKQLKKKKLKRKIILTKIKKETQGNIKRITFEIYISRIYIYIYSTFYSNFRIYIRFYSNIYILHSIQIFLKDSKENTYLISLIKFNK